MSREPIETRWRERINAAQPLTERELADLRDRIRTAPIFAVNAARSDLAVLVARLVATLDQVAASPGQDEGERPE